MNIILKKHTDPLFELITALHSIYNEKSLEEELRSSLNELDITQRVSIEKDFKKLQRFLTKLKDKVSIPKDRMNFFFKALSENFYSSENIAGLILNHMVVENLNEYRDKIQKLSESEIEKHIFESILRFLDFEETTDNFLNKDFITDCLIKNTSLRDTGKWHIMVLLNKPREHILEIIDIISSLIPIFNNLINTLNKELEVFTNKIECYLSEDTDFIKSLCKIDIEFTDDVYLYPTLINLNSISLMFTDVEILDFKKKSNIYFGWRFKELHDATHSGVDIMAKLHNNLKSLSDKSKLQIITMLKDKPMYGQEIADKLSLTTATVSHHMNNLMSSNFVYINKVENKIYYNVNSDEIKKFITLLNETLI